GVSCLRERTGATMSFIDLHSHTTASDGTLSPTQLVELAAKQGLSAIAVTDHDTIDGVAEAQAAGARLGLDVVPAIDISALSTRAPLMWTRTSSSPPKRWTSSTPPAAWRSSPTRSG